MSRILELGILNPGEHTRTEMARRTRFVRQLYRSCWSPTLELFSERHLTIFDEVSKLAEVIVTDGDLNKIDKMYQIRFINFEGESW